MAANEPAYLTGEIASTLGALLMIAGMIGVIRVMRGPRVSLGQIAAGIVTIGMIGLAGSFSFSVFDLAMAGFEDREAMVELRGELEDSAPYRAFWLVFSGAATVGGLILLAVSLYHGRVVPRWSPAAIFAAAVLWYVAGSEQALYAASWLLLGIALAPLAAWIRRDETTAT